MSSKRGAFRIPKSVLFLIWASLICVVTLSWADVEESLQYAPKRVVISEPKGRPTESPWHDPQATSRPLPQVAAAHAPDQTIAPEILRLYDADIVSGARPTYHVVAQADVFSLRRQPKFNADFVRLDVNLETLSQVQWSILHDWAVGGHNKIMLMGDEVGQYAEFLGARPAFFRSDNRAVPRPLTLVYPNLTNIDCTYVSVPFDWREYELSRCYVWEGITACRTPGAKVIAYYLEDTNMRPPEDEQETPHNEDDMVAAYGYFRAGQTTVYFRPPHLATGSDGYRFELNWTHWILGRKVPGRTSVRVPVAQAPPAGKLRQPAAMPAKEKAGP